mmetsp:Transcript_33668/g.103319  ORF Transcript_33668/g.103319 Transcript_33668/m.103319 type:complete len:207 (+) Transcript_33668:147-767(+)
MVPTEGTGSWPARTSWRRNSEAVRQGGPWSETSSASVATGSSFGEPVDAEKNVASWPAGALAPSGEYGCENVPRPVLAGRSGGLFTAAPGMVALPASANGLPKSELSCFGASAARRATACARRRVDRVVAWLMLCERGGRICPRASERARPIVCDRQGGGLKAENRSGVSRRRPTPTTQLSSSRRPAAAAVRHGPRRTTARPKSFC